MEQHDDLVLVRRCLNGDANAFAGLVKQHQRAVFNVAYRIVRDYEDASDVAQSAFVKAYEKLDTFNEQYKFFSWIYRIAVNEALNFVNKRKPEDELDERMVSNARGPEQLTEIGERNEQIQAALQDLPPDYRTVIVLRHFRELSYKEMAEVLLIPEKTVKSRLFTARRLLKDILIEHGIVDHE